MSFPSLSTFNLSAQDHLFLRVFTSQCVTWNNKRLTATPRTIRRQGAQDILFAWSELQARDLLPAAQAGTQGDFSSIVAIALAEIEIQGWEIHTYHFTAANKWTEAQ